MKCFMLMVVACGAMCCRAAETADDTSYLQERIDRGGCVILPAREYRISRTLKIGSGTHVRFEDGAKILLLPGSDCPLVGNGDVANGNDSITIEGGTWDMDNLRQSPNPSWRHLCKPPLPRLPHVKAYDPARYRGNAFYFENVSNLVVRGITIRNPVTYSFQMCRVSHFLVERVTFDFTTENPIKGNMDGIHLDGGCHHGRIAHLRGPCWDDMVAINANDGSCAAYEGPITDVEIEDLQSEGCHSAVRLLSTGAPVERISIRNIRGTYWQYAIGFTHFFRDRPQTGLFRDISISDVRVAKVPAPDDYPWRESAAKTPLFFYDANISISNLSVDGMEIENPK